MMERQSRAAASDTRALQVHHHLPAGERRNVNAVTDGGKTTTAAVHERAKTPTHTVRRCRKAAMPQKSTTTTPLPPTTESCNGLKHQQLRAQTWVFLPTTTRSGCIRPSYQLPPARPSRVHVRAVPTRHAHARAAVARLRTDIMTKPAATRPPPITAAAAPCVPVVAVCLKAEWRYAGVEGASLCSAAGRLLEIQLDKEQGTTPNIDLLTPPHVSGGSYAWPVSWLQPDVDPSNLPPHSAPFRTRRPEPTTNTVFAACRSEAVRRAPCPAGMGLAWTQRHGLLHA